MPTPRRGEKEADYVDRCIPVVIKEGTAKDGAQASAICHSMFRQHHRNEEKDPIQIHSIVNDNRVQTRTEMHQGRQHLVVPVVMMVEGVHNGSHGPLLHLAEELGRFVQAWNGIPVTIQHPEVNGNNVSANSPEIIDSWTVGRVYNSSMDGGRLRGEAWIDLAKITERSPQALAYIQQGRNLEVSVGVFSDEESTSGVWNNEEYMAIARNHRPDHLALLPGGTGACSWADGCGVRTNEKGGAVTDISKTIKELCSQGYTFLQVNDQGYRDLMQKIQGVLDAMDNQTKIHFLVEVYDGKCVYEVANRDTGVRVLYQQDYEVATNGAVALVGNPATVVRKVDYVAANSTSTSGNSKRGEETTMAEKKTPCCPGKVQALISSDSNPFQETDREFLLGLEEPQINSLITMDEAVAAAKKVSAQPVQVNKEQALQALKDVLSNPDEFMKLLPAKMQEQMRSGLKLHQERRQKLEKALTEANPTVFTAEKLKDQSMESLEDMVSLIPDKVDFTVNAGGGSRTTSPKEILLPPGVEATKA
jgi:hypothetical protein